MTTAAVKWISSNAAEFWKPRRTTPLGRTKANLALTGQAHQLWEGFGGCFNELGWQAMSHLSADARAKVMAALFDDAGCAFNMCRLPIGASDYATSWYSCNEKAGDFAMKSFTIERDRQLLIPYIKAALRLRPELKLFASPWSPPTWMKNPAVYNFGKLVWEKKNLAAYALYFVKFVQAYAREGIQIDQIHPQNEPRGDQKFPSCLWSGQQMRDFIRDHLGPAFEKAELPCEIWLGTLNCGDFDAYPNTVLSDERARRFVAGVGFQWEGKLAIQRTHESFPDVRLMQTENECGDGANTWEYAQYVFSLIRHYISNGANAYVYWNMVLPTGGESSWGWPQNSLVCIDEARKQVRYNPEFYVMKHCSRFVAPGARRVSLIGPWTGNSLAFANPDGSVVLMASNPLEYARPLNFSTGTKGFAAEIPARSINTFVVEAQ